MRKLLFFLSVLVLTGACALPSLGSMYDRDGIMVKMFDAEAPAAIFHGEFTFGMATPFDASKGAIGFKNSYIDVSIWPFEYNAITVELEQGGEFWSEASGGAPFWKAPYIYLTTDIGAYFYLPIWLVNNIGVTSLYSRRYEVTGHTYERNLVRSGIDPIAWYAEMDVGIFTLDFGLGFGEGDPDDVGPLTAKDMRDIGMILMVPELGPIDLEAFYLAQDNRDYKGNIGMDAKLQDIVPLLDFAGGFMYDLVDENFFYGFGAMFTYFGKLNLGFSFNGWDEDAVYQMGFDAAVDFGGYGLEAGLGLSLAGTDYGTFPNGEDSPGDDTETFQGAEVSVWLAINTATLRAGYIITENSYSYASAVAPPEGGFFITADIDF
jgi:hypothetical protein